MTKGEKFQMADGSKWMVVETAERIEIDSKGKEKAVVDCTTKNLRTGEIRSRKESDLAALLKNKTITKIQ